MKTLGFGQTADPSQGSARCERCKANYQVDEGDQVIISNPVLFRRQGPMATPAVLIEVKCPGCEERIVVTPPSDPERPVVEPTCRWCGAGRHPKSFPDDQYGCGSYPQHVGRARSSGCYENKIAQLEATILRIAGRL